MEIQCLKIYTDDIVPRMDAHVFSESKGGNTTLHTEVIEAFGSSKALDVYLKTATKGVG